jgi:predicted glycosyltransferase involved in capsule biosynthesis
MDPKENHYQFENNFKGFRKFFGLLNQEATCVMEATGA